MGETIKEATGNCRHIKLRREGQVVNAFLLLWLHSLSKGVGEGRGAELGLMMSRAWVLGASH